MESTQYNIFDIFVAIILFASGVFAFRRGLVKEVTALGTWILASLFAFAFYPLAKPFLQNYIENAMIADAATALGLFSVAVIILVPLGDYLSNLVQSPTLSSINRSLGFVFGLIRGFLIVCLIFLGMTFFWSTDNDEDDQPKWLAEARTKPALIYGVDLIKAFVPENAEESAKETIEESRKAAEDAIEAAKQLEDFSTPSPLNFGDDNDTTTEPESYEEDSRDTMDNLIDRNESE